MSVLKQTELRIFAKVASGSGRIILHAAAYEAQCKGGAIICPLSVYFRRTVRRESVEGNGKEMGFTKRDKAYESWVSELSPRFRRNQ